MKFSIITPSYNQAKFLDQTINSVISQQGEFEVEYFILDGGSTDGSVEIIKKYKSTPKVKIIWQSKPDGGQANALNYGLSKATGDIIAYINSDDYYLPNTFSKVQTFFDTHPTKLWLVGNCRISDPRLAWTFFLKHLWPIQYFRSSLLVFNTINQPSVFLRKKIVDEVGLFDTTLHYAFDYNYWLRCTQVQLPSRIFSSLSVFRIHSQSKGNSNFTSQFDEDWIVFIKQQPKDFYYFIHAIVKDFVKLIYSFLK